MIIILEFKGSNYFFGGFRPMYQYEAAGGTLPVGFSAINLSVKCVTTAQPHMKGVGPQTSPGGSVIDLSTSSVPTTSPQVRGVTFLYSNYDQVTEGYFSSEF